MLEISKENINRVIFPERAKKRKYRYTTIFEIDDEIETPSYPLDRSGAPIIVRRPVRFVLAGKHETPRRVLFEGRPVFAFPISVVELDNYDTEDLIEDETFVREVLHFLDVSAEVQS